MIAGGAQVIRTTITAILLAGVSLLAHAAGGDVAPGSDGPDQQKQWRTVDADMSPVEYDRAVRENQKLVRRLVKSYSSETLDAVGVPRAGVAFLGAAAGLAVNGDAQWHLNDSKTMAFSFDDVTSDDRALMFRIKKRW
jgi:hypothetical protein